MWGYHCRAVQGPGQVAARAIQIHPDSRAASENEGRPQGPPEQGCEIINPSMKQKAVLHTVFFIFAP